MVVGGGGGGYSLKNNIPGVIKVFFYYKICCVSKKKIPGKSILEAGGALGVFGVAPHPTGGHAGLENVTLLPLTITHDRQKFWNDLPCRSKLSSGNLGGRTFLTKP